MTVIAMPAPSNEGALPRTVPWRRMVWVTWRQHRGTLIGVPAVLGAVAVFLMIAGLKIHHDYAVLIACSNACGNLNRQFNHSDWAIGNGIDIFVNIAPALIGAFAGAPVLARELESGTYRFAWTQGLGRERWTIAKLALIAGTIGATAALFALLNAWFFQPFLKQEDMTVMSTTVFDVRPVAFVAWTLVALAMGAFTGMLIRRIVPAMATTLAAYTGLALGAWALVGTNSMSVSRFWPLQLIEGGCLLALSVLLIGATVLLVRRRAA